MVHTASRYLTPTPAMATVHWDSMLDTSTSQKTALPPRQRSNLKILLNDGGTHILYNWCMISSINSSIVANPKSKTYTLQCFNQIIWEFAIQMQQTECKNHHDHRLWSSARDVWRFVFVCFHPICSVVDESDGLSQCVTLFFPVMFLSSLYAK